MYYISMEIGRLKFNPDDPPYVKRDTIDGVIYIDGEEEFRNQMMFEPDELPKHFKKK